MNIRKAVDYYLSNVLLICVQLAVTKHYLILAGVMQQSVKDKILSLLTNEYADSKLVLHLKPHLDQNKGKKMKLYAEI